MKEVKIRLPDEFGALAVTAVAPCGVVVHTFTNVFNVQTMEETDVIIIKKDDGGYELKPYTEVTDDA